MIQQMISKPTMGINYQIYFDKVKKYEPTYTGMIEDFCDSIFGEFSNRVHKDQFKSQLAHHGWKYFEKRNLNELFHIMS